MAYPQASAIQQGGTIVKVGSISPRCINTGGTAASNTSDGAEVAVSLTAMFTAELLAPAPSWSTGVSVFNGTRTDAWTERAALYSSTGQIIARTSAVAVTTSDIYLSLPWAFEFVSVSGTATALAGRLYLPAGTYYIGVNAYAIGGGSNKHNCVTVGAHGTSNITIVAATAFDTTSLTITPPTTFTTNVGPYASLY